MSQNQMKATGDKVAETVEVALNAEDRKYARSVLLASQSLDLLSVLTSASAKRNVMRQLAILESRYFYLEDTALSLVAEEVGRTKLSLLPVFRNAASVGRELPVDYRTMMLFTPAKLTLTRR